MTEAHKVGQAMRIYGGSFVEHLGGHYSTLTPAILKKSKMHSLNIGMNIWKVVSNRVSITLKITAKVNIDLVEDLKIPIMDQAELQGFEGA